jgi:hypothetical protein
MISSDKNCTTATKKKSMNSYALAILENLYVRGMILPRYLPLPKGSESVSANREVYPNINRWSTDIIEATSETLLENALDSMRNDILGLLNHASRKESFEMPGPTRQPNIEKLEVIRIGSTPKKPINAETGLILLRLDAWKQGACLPRNPNKLEFQTGTDLTTEHILPQTPILPWGSFTSFTTQPTVNENVQKIGNLMLLPSGDNSGLSNKPIEEKFDTDPRSYVIISHTHPKNQLLADAISKSGVPGTRDWSENIVKDRGRDMADWLYESFHDDVLTRNRWK